MNNKTVYVIGAGASKEANLPTGEELKKIIANRLDIYFNEWNKLEKGDAAIVNALMEYVQDPYGESGRINSYLEEAWHIRKALPLAISIDNFIDTQKDNVKLELCGKLAIVRSLLIAEKESLLYFEQKHIESTIPFNEIEDTWYVPFFRTITENCSKEDIQSRLQNVKLIIFNYDRCIEHFLFHAFQTLYNASPDEAAELVSYIDIYHPYGRIGHLPWENNLNATFFGAINQNPRKLLELAREIKTFTEGTDPSSSDIVSIREHINTANRLVFLGFAFHKLNMELIRPSKPTRQRRGALNCYASTLGISESDRRMISEQVDGLYSLKLDLAMSNTTCRKFFDEFWRSLAF